MRGGVTQSQPGNPARPPRRFFYKGIPMTIKTIMAGAFAAATAAFPAGAVNVPTAGRAIAPDRDAASPQQTGALSLGHPSGTEHTRSSQEPLPLTTAQHTGTSDGRLSAGPFFAEPYNPNVRYSLQGIVESAKYDFAIAESKLATLISER
jgi:hypothetical protein